MTYDFLCTRATESHVHDYDDCHGDDGDFCVCGARVDCVHPEDEEN